MNTHTDVHSHREHEDQSLYSLSKYISTVMCQTLTLLGADKSNSSPLFSPKEVGEE